jgi:hypothetical protein
MADPETIYNWRRLDNRITTSGQPTEPQLTDIQALGVRHIVNLGLHSHEKCGAAIRMRTRIASPGMLLEAEPLPHLICSRPMFIGGVKDEADQYGGAGRVGGSDSGAVFAGGQDGAEPYPRGVHGDLMPCGLRSAHYIGMRSLAILPFFEPVDGTSRAGEINTSSASQLIEHGSTPGEFEQ